jgi:hypothetical protein
MYVTVHTDRHNTTQHKWQCTPTRAIVENCSGMYSCHVTVCGCLCVRARVCLSDGRNLKLLDLTGAGGNVSTNGQVLGGAVLRNFALLRQLEGCTVLADFHDKSARNSLAKPPLALKYSPRGAVGSVSRQAHLAQTAARAASSNESSWLPVVNALKNSTSAYEGIKYEDAFESTF